MSNAFELTVNALRSQGLNSEEILQEMSKLFEKLAQTRMELAESKTTEERIRQLLNEVAVPTHVKGYRYWIEAIGMYQKDNDLQMAEIYNGVAEICETTPSKVEKDMRYAAEYAFKKYPKDNIESFFGSKAYVNRKKLTNTEFLTILAGKI